jgi:hypothetical protein
MTNQYKSRSRMGLAGLALAGAALFGGLATRAYCGDQTFKLQAGLHANQAREQERRGDFRNADASYAASVLADYLSESGSSSSSSQSKTDEERKAKEHRLKQFSAYIPEELREIEKVIDSARTSSKRGETLGAREYCKSALKKTRALRDFIPVWAEKGTPRVGIGYGKYLTLEDFIKKINQLEWGYSRDLFRINAELGIEDNQ